ncbi:MAG TPA: hypothetical protein PKY82_00540 [Pyrinomonadaceae bacterium]|nr:hypothetical protein [Pyrinomonadaceae bacterium]
MKQTELKVEEKVAEIQGNERLNSGLNWAIISFALIILTIIVTGIIFLTPLPKKIEDKVNGNTNVSASPVGN